MPESNRDNKTQDTIIIIDMNKLPEEIREKFPKDLQDKLMELLQTDQQFQVDKKLQADQQEKSTKNKTTQNRQDTKPSLFAIQQGFVIGNVYRDDI